MKKLLRTFLLATILSLTLSFIPSKTAYAETGNGTSGESKQTSGTWFDGVSWSKSGFLIYVVQEENYGGDESASLVRQPVLVFVQGAPTNTYTKYYVNAKAGGGSFKQVFTGGAPWGLPPFNDNGSGNGGAIKDWLCSPQGESKSGAGLVITKYWGAEAAEDFWNSAKTEHMQYLCVETVVYHGLYNGDQVVTDAGNPVTICATASWLGYKIYSLSGKDLGNGYPFKSYDFQNVPYSLMYQYSWLGIPIPSQTSGQITDPLKLWKEGYGIISVRPTDKGGGGGGTHTWDSVSYPRGSSYQIEKAPKEQKSEKVTIVKTYREQVEIPDGWDDENDEPIMQKKTVYHGTFYRDETLKSIRIEDEDGYKVIEWQTSTETKPTNVYPSGSAVTWEEVTEHSSKTHKGSKSGYTTLSDTEHVLYVLLEKSNTSKTI